MGRPNKGQRDAILAKPPVAFGEILKRNAESQGLTYGEYMVALAAAQLNMPQFSPARSSENHLDFAQEARTRTT